MNQRKQELEHNELADAIGEQLEKIKPYIAKIGIAIAILAAATIGIYWWRSSANAGLSESWAAKIFASQVVEMERDPKPLETVWKTHEPPASFWAMLDAGYFELASGNDSYIKDNSSARTQLKSAKKKFEQILKEADSKHADLRLKARYLLAYTHESLGEFKDAKKEYKAVIDSEYNQAFKELAEQGLSRVNDPKTIEMFDKYVNWTPPVAPPANLQRPDISFPEDIFGAVGTNPGGDGAFNPGQGQENNGENNNAEGGNADKEKPDSNPPTDLNPPVKKDDTGGEGQQGQTENNSGENEEKKDDNAAKGDGQSENSDGSNGGSGSNPPENDDNK